MYCEIATAVLSAVMAAIEALTPANKCTPPSDYPKPGPLGRYVVSAMVDDVDQTDGMGAVIDAWGYEWYYTDRPDLHDGQRVTVVYDAMGTPDDLRDDEIVDIFGACPEGSPCRED